MSVTGSGALQPTYLGHVSTTRDALLLFEACLSGHLSHVPRRPHDRERSSLIKSGSVFIYEENASGIKRWTDGVPWSPSRILGNFLVYRELIKPFPPGEKKRATKKNKRPSRPGEPYPRPSADPSNPNGSGSFSPTSPTTPAIRSEGSLDRDAERALIGSLVDSYGFKEKGLVKKTMSVNVGGVHHHLVSYYNIDEVTDGTLRPPSKDSRVQHLVPRADLVSRQNFRAPLDEVDEGIQEHVDGSHNHYNFDNGGGFDQRQMMSSQGYPQHHPSNMPTYSPLIYSTGQQPSNIPSYAPTQPNVTHYYPQQHSVPHGHGAPKPEDYNSYSPSTYSTPHRFGLDAPGGPDRGSVQAPHLPLAYRQQNVQQPMQSRPIKAEPSPGSQDFNASDAGAYGRQNYPGGLSHYQQDGHTPQYSNGQSWNIQAPPQSVSRPEAPGYQTEGTWQPISTPAAGRNSSYPGGATHH